MTPRANIRSASRNKEPKSSAVLKNLPGPALVVSSGSEGTFSHSDSSDAEATSKHSAKTIGDAHSFEVPSKGMEMHHSKAVVIEVTKDKRELTVESASEKAWERPARNNLEAHTQRMLCPPSRKANTTSSLPVAFEIFAGAAGLSWALMKEGFDATGVDHRGNKDKPKAPTIWLDLTTSSGQTEMLKLLGNKELKYVHFAPPCGTCSLSREIRRFNEDGTPSSIDPKPLRSKEFPDGIEGLAGKDLQRVTDANELYKFTVKAVKLLHKNKVAWTVESPTNSRMWDTGTSRN